MKKNRVLAILLFMCIAMVFAGGVTTLAEEPPEPEWVLEGEHTIQNERYRARSIASGDSLYFIGGQTDPTNYSVKVDIYNTKTKEWTNGADVPKAIYEPSLAAYKNKIYVFGGLNGSGEKHDSLYIYDTVTNSWSQGADYPITNNGMHCAVVDAKIYAIGGSDDSDGVYIYDIASNTWSQGADAPSPKVYLAAATAVGKKIYLAGGYSNATTQTNSLIIYDTVTDTWVQGANLPSNVVSAAAVALGDEIYVIRDNTTSSYIYDTKSDNWREGLRYKAPVDTASIIDGKVYASTVRKFGTGNDNKTIGLYPIYSLQVGEFEPEPEEALLSVLLMINEQVQLSLTHNLADNANYN